MYLKKKMAKSIKRQALSIQDPCLYDKSKKKTSRLHIYFIRNLCVGVEAEVHYFSEDSEDHSSLISFLLF